MLKLAYFDDDREMLKAFQTNLNKDFHVVTEESSINYPNVLERGPFDAIVIDLEMPNLDGFQLYEKILSHTDYNGCPIIFMTEDETDKTTLFALQLGAEDVIHRHWSPEIQAERIRQRVLRYLRDHIYQLDNLRVDKKRYKVTLDNRHIELSLTEFKLVCSLVSQYPTPAEFADIFQAVWGTEMDEKNLHTHLSNLRKKLKGWTLNFKTAGGRKIGIVQS